MLFKKTYNKPWHFGLFQAVITATYVSFVAFFMNRMADIFSGKPNQPMVMGTIFLLVFSLSALVCGTTTLAYPLKLALNKKVKEAMQIVSWTILFLALIVVLIIGALIINTYLTF